MEIKFEDPDETARIIGTGQQAGKYQEFAVALREHEGQWAVLPEPEGEERTPGGANATAQNIRNGKVKGFAPKDSYEVALKGTKIWVRYKGNPMEVKVIEPDEDLGKRVRRWAANEGIEVPKHGRLSNAILRQWAEATGNELPVRGV